MIFTKKLPSRMDFFILSTKLIFFLDNTWLLLTGKWNMICFKETLSYLNMTLLIYHKRETLAFLYQKLKCQSTLGVSSKLPAAESSNLKSNTIFNLWIWTTVLLIHLVKIWRMKASVNNTNTTWDRCLPLI